MIVVVIKVVKVEVKAAVEVIVKVVRSISSSSNRNSSKVIVLRKQLCRKHKYNIMIITITTKQFTTIQAYNSLVRHFFS